MALDTLDFAVILVLTVAILAYIVKTNFFSEPKSTGFLSADALAGNNLLDVIKKNNKNAVIFYGSQTGTAEDYASKLSKELSARFGLKTMTVDFSDYDLTNFDSISEDTLCFFLMATYGEGEPTDNANEFCEWLENDADTLSTLKFTVFGLGNSTYELYNAVGKKLDQQFEEKGAERFADYGEGDDGKGTLDEDFLTWKDNLFESLKNNLNLEEHELTYEPVSYTHLDVYKRQGLFHPARKVRSPYWKLYNYAYMQNSDSLVPYYPQIENLSDDDTVEYHIEELDLFL